mgnify:CR=1 FL=1
MAVVPRAVDRFTAISGETRLLLFYENTWTIRLISSVQIPFQILSVPPLAAFAGRPYRPVPRTLDLESIQSVLFATSSNWPLPYKTLRSTLSLQLPPQTTLGEEGERHMSQVRLRYIA